MKKYRISEMRNRFNAERNRNGQDDMTWREVCEQVGIDANTLRDYRDCPIEEKKRHNNLDILQRFATLFGCEVYELFNTVTPKDMAETAEQNIDNA